MSIVTRLSRCFGIVRINTELPNSQKQKTPSLPSTAVSPLGHRRNRPPSPESTMPPRGAPRVRRAEAEVAPAVVANTAAAMGTHGVRRPTHIMLDSMREATPDHRRLTGSLFEPTNQLFGAMTDFASALARVDLSRVPPTPGLPGAPTVLLAQALAAATGGNATLALAALEALGKLDPQQEIITAWQQHAHGESAAPADGGGEASMVAKQAAWRVAMALADTPSGMDVLQAVVARAVDPAQHEDFTLLLKAVAAMPAGDPAGADPAAILASNTALSTLPREAVACAAARMAGEVEAARPHQWALTAVRNDLFDTGPGTDFAAINARLMKMGRWIERATPERRRWFRNPIVGKSPFRAWRHGAQEVDRGPAIARHRLARETALREAAVALKDRLVVPAPRLRTPGPGQVPQALLRAAVLEHCLQAAAPQALERAGFAEDARIDIAERLARMLSPSSGATGPEEDGPSALARRLSALPDLCALADVQLDAQTLAQWFSQARQSVGDGGVEMPDAPEEASWVETVSTALARAEDEAQGRDTRVPLISRDTVRSGLKDIIANIEGSSRLRLSSGGIVGVGLRQITASISALASAFFLRGRVDAKVQRGRQAVFEIAMPPYDMEIVIGTQRQVAGQVGVGGFAGPDIGIAKAGINVDTVLYGKETADVTGVSLRLPRVGRPVPELRAEFSALVDTLLDGSEGGVEAGEGPTLLHRLLQEYPDLTVNQIGAAGDGRRRHGLGVDFVGSIGKLAAKVSASVGGFIEAQRNVTKHYADATGRMRVERSIVGHTTKAGAAIKASFSPTATVASETAISDSVDVSIAAAQVGVSAEHVLSGTFERREAVYEDGRLHPLSFVETEYNHVNDFLSAMEPQFDAWVNAGIDPARLEHLLADIREHVAPNHSFATRSTVTPEARARNDVYRSAIQLCAKHPNGVEEAVAAFKAETEAQWNDPAAVQPYSVRSYARNMVQTTHGLELVMQLASIEVAEASHIDNRLDVPANRPVLPAPVLRPATTVGTLSRSSSEEFFTPEPTPAVSPVRSSEEFHTPEQSPDRVWLQPPG